MTNEEMTDLDVWIAINLFGYRWTDNPDDSTIDDVKQVWITERGKKCVVSHTWQYGVETNAHKRFNHSWNDFQPTRCSGDAFEVLRKCNELLNERNRRVSIDINMFGGNKPMVVYAPMDFPPYTHMFEYADTLELAICQFAKKMFEKV